MHLAVVAVLADTYSCRGCIIRLYYITVAHPQRSPDEDIANLQRHGHHICGLGARCCPDHVPLPRMVSGHKGTGSALWLFNFFLNSYLE